MVCFFSPRSSLTQRSSEGSPNESLNEMMAFTAAGMVVGGENSTLNVRPQPLPFLPTTNIRSDTGTIADDLER